MSNQLILIIISPHSSKTFQTYKALLNLFKPYQTNKTIKKPYKTLETPWWKTYLAPPNLNISKPLLQRPNQTLLNIMLNFTHLVVPPIFVFASIVYLPAPLITIIVILSDSLIKTDNKKLEILILPSVNIYYLKISCFCWKLIMILNNLDICLSIINL